MLKQKGKGKQFYTFVGERWNDGEDKQQRKHINNQQ